MRAGGGSGEDWGDGVIIGACSLMGSPAIF